ncbi:glycosyltransferase [Nonlabens sp.]|uniref:glycosyltransferase n=1 Tax=Nonlabens sp. TaxID=1888209 RepID=UPI003F69E41F
MITVVIRNKNEALALEKLLALLDRFYKDDIHEIIIVDNESSDDSEQVVHKYGATLISIKNFTYGKALNLGISKSTQPFIALLSAHAYPLGDDFFKDSLKKFQLDDKIAGLRYINSFKDYERFIENDGIILEPLEYGMMNACAMIRKSVWQEFNYDERLMFSEDKLWSQQVTNYGYRIEQMRHAFFYNVKRNSSDLLERWSNETIAGLINHQRQPKSALKTLLIFLKEILWIGLKNYGTYVVHAFIRFKKRLGFKSRIKEYHNHNE